MTSVCGHCGHSNRADILFCTHCGARLTTSSADVHLLVLYGPDRGQTFTISSESTTIGRERSNDIVLHDPAVSSHHAELLYANGELAIVDCKSRNGVRVNGERICERSELKDEYLLKLGNTLLRVRIPDERDVSTSSASYGDRPPAAPGSPNRRLDR